MLYGWMRMTLFDFRSCACNAACLDQKVPRGIRLYLVSQASISPDFLFDYAHQPSQAHTKIRTWNADFETYVRCQYKQFVVTWRPCREQR